MEGEHAPSVSALSTRLWLPLKLAVKRWANSGFPNVAGTSTDLVLTRVTEERPPEALRDAELFTRQKGTPIATPGAPTLCVTGPFDLGVRSVDAHS